jgi:superoxide reductase
LIQNDKKFYMTKLKQIYKCSVCGNVVEVLHAAEGELVCCGQPMNLQDEKVQEEGTEKHLPVIEEMPANVCQGKDGVIIKVGDVPHPMEEEHYIEWIEIITADGKTGKRFLKPGDKPEVEFYTRQEVVGARAYCNVHGVWKLDV